MLLGQRLILEGAITAANLDKALELQRQAPGERLGTILIRMGTLSEKTPLTALSTQLGIPVIADSELLSQQAGIVATHLKYGIPAALASRLSFSHCPHRRRDRPADWRKRYALVRAIEYLETSPFADFELRYALVTTRDLERLLTSVYRSSSAGQQDDLRKLAEDAPVVELVNGVMARATDTRASDVHIEPEEAGFNVRYRIDGALHGTEHYPRERFDAVVSRIKLISGLDIAERRLPQDGRFSIRVPVDTGRPGFSHSRRPGRIIGHALTAQHPDHALRSQQPGDRARSPGALSLMDGRTGWHRSGHRSNRIRQKHDAVCHFDCLRHRTRKEY